MSNYLTWNCCSSVSAFRASKTWLGKKSVYSCKKSFWRCHFTRSNFYSNFTFVSQFYFEHIKSWTLKQLQCKTLHPHPLEFIDRNSHISRTWQHWSFQFSINIRLFSSFMNFFYHSIKILYFFCSSWQKESKI